MLKWLTEPSEQTAIDEYPTYQYSDRVKRILARIQDLQDENARLIKQSDELKKALHDITGILAKCDYKYMPPSLEELFFGEQPFESVMM